MCLGLLLRVCLDACRCWPLLLVLVITGCQVLSDVGVGAPPADRMTCGDRSLTFQGMPDDPLMHVGGREYELDQVESASGSRYVASGSDGTGVWIRGERARLTLAGNDLPTCTYASGDQLSEPVWTLTELVSQEVIVNYRATLRFSAAGRVSGRLSCNHYRASWQRIGEQLIIDNPITTTRMACNSEVMEQEHRFLNALGRVERFELAQNGDLLLYGRDRLELIRARPNREHSDN